MKTTWLTTAAVTVAICGMAGMAEATPISGSIAFEGEVELNGTAGTATEVLNWTGIDGTGLPVVEGGVESFSGIARGTEVTFAAPWQLNGGPVSDFWTLGGFTYSLTDSFQINEFGDVAGNGVVGNGVSTEPMTWFFSPIGTGTSTANGVIYLFQAVGNTEQGPSVPDGGTTAMLLGLGMLGLGLLKKQMFA